MQLKSLQIPDFNSPNTDNQEDPIKFKIICDIIDSPKNFGDYPGIYIEDFGDVILDSCTNLMFYNGYWNSRSVAVEMNLNETNPIPKQIQFVNGNQRNFLDNVHILDFGHGYAVFASSSPSKAFDLVNFNSFFTKIFLQI